MNSEEKTGRIWGKEKSAEGGINSSGYGFTHHGQGETPNGSRTTIKGGRKRKETMPKAPLNRYRLDLDSKVTSHRK